jgi:hypothetical protein
MESLDRYRFTIHKIILYLYLIIHNFYFFKSIEGRFFKMPLLLSIFQKEKSAILIPKYISTPTQKLP